MNDSKDKLDEVVEETEETSLDSFSTLSKDESDGEDTKESSSKSKKTKRKPRRARKTKTTTKKKEEKKKPDTKAELVEAFIAEHSDASLSRMIAIFSKRYDVPRLFESDILFVSPARDPRIVLKYMYSKRQQ